MSSKAHPDCHTPRVQPTQVLACRWKLGPEMANKIRAGHQQSLLPLLHRRGNGDLPGLTLDPSLQHRGHLEGPSKHRA